MRLSTCPSRCDLKLVQSKILWTCNSLTQGSAAGISCVIDLPQLGKFVTGGYDHAVRVWSLGEGMQHASDIPLDIKHSSLVQSLLHLEDTGQKLVTAGADCCVNVWDMPSQTALNTIKTSNSVYHVHRTPIPHTILFEVSLKTSRSLMLFIKAAIGSPS